MAKNGRDEGARKSSFIGFCRAHRFHPTVVVIALILIVVLLCGTVLWGVGMISTVESRTTDLGLKNIGELATQSALYRNVQVISNSREVFGVTVPFTQSHYIYSYDGTIKVGYNFGSIEVATDDVAKTITVQLPEPMVISNDIDENSLKVYDESKSIFAPLKLSQVNASQSAMKKEALETAIQNGLYESARANAETLIRGFLSGSFNLQEYAIVFQSADPSGEQT